jgi:hypothetical protein
MLMDQLLSRLAGVSDQEKVEISSESKEWYLLFLEFALSGIQEEIRSTFDSEHWSTETGLVPFLRVLKACAELFSCQKDLALSEMVTNQKLSNVVHVAIQDLLHQLFFICFGLLSCLYSPKLDPKK